MHISTPLAIISSLASFFAFAAAQDSPIRLYSEPGFNGPPLDVVGDGSCTVLTGPFERNLRSIEIAVSYECTLYQSGDCSPGSDIRTIFDTNPNLFEDGSGGDTQSVMCQASE
ncbi:hypothetical protein AJ78_05304 [Emergomyces pasteurianus Ep9510]|uniref:AA1-like domain-containing protein n=1 Tax=Emergomyces pasteurianus Ep9510 TaxID=1447872 RepID=A0A1J9Q2C2_9EURO|nr:hypothetical protein AJ78_05304 [Emergomyces pasteurianus Ep9510]